ncbi:MAG: D-alanyl-D-alanine carboxypeptidase family protein [Schaedlerella sp.]|nr:D-alanyl-D-alanine carboxypeptidase family protein [Schaedlerella sp.]
MGKLLCAAISSAILLTQPCAAVLAEEEKTAEEILQEEKREVYDLKIDTNSLTGWPEGPNVQAYAACVMDMDSGAVLFSKNMNEKLYPASITKLLTVLVALENAELTDTVVITEECLDFLEPGDAYIGMRAGEEISMEDALYAVLLASANEVSYAVAETVGTNNLGGDYSTFIQKMNDRAKELGCLSSNWVNANGLHDENHYTTAYDMALIASELYKYEKFLEIMNTYEHKIPETNLVNEKRTFQQNHKMLFDGNDYSWELATGGKTGYTDQARTTLVTMADNGEKKLAAVVLKDYGVDSYTDTRKMMEYGFSSFSKIKLADEVLPEEIESFSDEAACILLPETVDFSSVECEIMPAGEEDSESGTAVFTYEDQIVGKAEVVLKKADLTQKKAAVDTEKSEEKIITEDSTKFTMTYQVMLVLAGALGMLLLIILFVFYRNYKKLKARRKRRKEKQAAKHRRKNLRYRRKV